MTNPKECVTHHICDCLQTKLEIIEAKLIIAREALAEVIRNSHDIISKKRCSEALHEIEENRKARE